MSFTAWRHPCLSCLPCPALLKVALANALCDDNPESAAALTFAWRMQRSRRVWGWQKT